MEGKLPIFRVHMPKAPRALTLVLSAMPSEIRLIQGRMEPGAKAGTLAVFPYKRGVLNGRPVVTAVTGVGVTNAAMVTALFVHAFKPTEVIVSGTGSRFNPRVRTGDTVVSIRTIHHAAGSLTAEGMVYRKVRGPLEGEMTHWQYAPDARLLKLAKASMPGYEAEPVTAGGETYRPTVLTGVVTASDLFGVSDEKIADLRAKLDPDIMEMGWCLEQCLLLDLQVVSGDEKVDGVEVVFGRFGEGVGFAHQAADAGAQGAKPTLHVAGLALGLGAATVRSGRKGGRAGYPKISAGGASPVVLGQGGSDEFFGRAPPTARASAPCSARSSRDHLSSSTSLLRGQERVHKGGELPGSLPQPAHHRHVVNSKGAVNVVQAHPVLISGQNLILELRAVARPSGREAKCAFALHAERPLRPALGAAVLLQAFAATVRAGMDQRRQNDPASSCQFAHASTSV